MRELPPLLSIGMPVYNSSTYVAEALSSILGQTLGDFELIISDNASDDGTEEICRDFATADSRIRYQRNETNIGCPLNYNAVAKLARGTYFKWSSSNDICQPRFVEACITALERCPDAVLSYPRTIFFDSTNGRVEEYDDNLFLDQDDPVARFRACDERMNYNNIMNGVIRTRELMSTTLHWNYASSDLALIRELSLYGKFVEIPERLFHRRMDSAAHFGSGTKAQRGRYYPRERFGSRFRNFRQLHQMFVGVSRAPLPWRDRARLYDYLARRTWWHRHDLGWPAPSKSAPIL